MVEASRAVKGLPALGSLHCDAALGRVDALHDVSLRHGRRPLADEGRRLSGGSSLEDDFVDGCLAGLREFVLPVVETASDEAALRDGDGREEKEQEIEFPVPLVRNSEQVPFLRRDEEKPLEVPRAFPLRFPRDGDCEVLYVLGTDGRPYSWTPAIMRR